MNESKKKDPRAYSLQLSYPIARQSEELSKKAEGAKSCPDEIAVLRAAQRAGNNREHHSNAEKCDSPVQNKEFPENENNTGEENKSDNDAFYTGHLKRHSERRE